MVSHPDPRDEPNVGRTHSVDLIDDCGLCRCGAHNIEDDPSDCADCLLAIDRAMEF